MQKLSEVGEHHLPTFSHLLGDMWASLYKMTPEVMGEVEQGLSANKQPMESIMTDESYQNFREFTRLDDLSSAIGTVKFGEKTNDWLSKQAEENEALRKWMEQARNKIKGFKQRQAELTIEANGAGKEEQKLERQLQQELEQVAQVLQQLLEQAKVQFRTGNV